MITTSFDQRLPFVQPSQFGLDEDRALERNQEIIEESTVEDWLPRWFDEAGDGSFGPMAPILDCNTVAAPDEFAGLGLTWIASVDMLADAHPGRFCRHRLDRRHRVLLAGQPVHHHDELGLAVRRADHAVDDVVGSDEFVEPRPPRRRSSTSSHSATERRRTTSPPARCRAACSTSSR